MIFRITRIFLLAFVVASCTARPIEPPQIGKIGNGATDVISGGVFELKPGGTIGDPLANVTVISGDDSTSTDADGLWALDRASDATIRSPVHFFRRGYGAATRLAADLYNGSGEHFTVR